MEDLSKYLKKKDTSTIQVQMNCTQYDLCSDRKEFQTHTIEWDMGFDEFDLMEKGLALYPEDL